MKKFILLLLVALVTVFNISTSFAQGFSEVTKTSKTKQALVDITVSSKSFKGGTTKSGNIFVMRVSQKSGKEYRQYLGKPLNKTFSKDSKTYKIYVKNHRDGNKSFYYYTISKSGYPSQHKLKKD